MYVASGLGGYRTRRGMGAPLGYDEEGLPIENPADTTYTETTGTSLPQKMGPPVPFSVSPTSWLNANATTVAIGASVFVLALLFARSGR